MMQIIAIEDRVLFRDTADTVLMQLTPDEAEQLRRGKLATDLMTRLRTEHAARRPATWTVSIDAERAEAVSEERYQEDTLLGEFLRTVRHYVERSDDRLDLQPYLAERHVAGHLPSAVTLDEPAVRGRVLAEVARLGVALLSPGEPRP